MSTNTLIFSGTFLLLIYALYLSEFDKSHLAEETVPVAKSSANLTDLIS